jgi:hypothetical protein
MKINSLHINGPRNLIVNNLLVIFWQTSDLALSENILKKTFSIPHRKPKTSYICTPKPTLGEIAQLVRAQDS